MQNVEYRSSDHSCSDCNDLFIDVEDRGMQQRPVGSARTSQADLRSWSMTQVHGEILTAHAGPSQQHDGIISQCIPSGALKRLGN